MSRYLKYIKPYINYFILAPAMMLIEVAGEVAMPYWLGQIINNGIVNQDVSYILKMSVIMVLTGFLMMIGGVGAAYFASKASINFASDLRLDVFKKIQKFSFDDIDNFRAGSLITRLTNDINQIQNFIMMVLRAMLRAPGMLIGALIMAFTMNTKLAFIILFVLPFLGFAIVVVMKKAIPKFGLMQRKLDNLNNTVQEVLINIRVVKSFVREDNENEKFENVNEELKDASVKAYKISALQSPIMTLIMNFTIALVVWVGGNEILKGNMPLGDLSAFIMYITQILMSLSMLAMVLMESSRAITSSRRITEVLDREVSIVDKVDNDRDKHKHMFDMEVSNIQNNSLEKENIIVEKGTIEFKNVNFKYYKEREEKVLENINLKINTGESVGIIGPTGCGKTTLVSMILRLYDVDNGEVLVDNVNVKKYSLKNLRDGVSIVLQNNLLFSGKIIENIRWGDENATYSGVENVSNIAQAHNFVTSFSDGYDTMLGQRGVNISGGQKQRLCISRALLKKSKILILDDSTSALDTVTESKIQASFNKDLKDITKIIIAQRIGSIISMDKIIVMEEGKIVGIGSHKELLENCETYQEIYFSQIDSKEVTL